MLIIAPRQEAKKGYLFEFLLHGGMLCEKSLKECLKEERLHSNKGTWVIFGLNIFYFLNKYDNISIHCNLQITGSERKQEYLYSSSPEHIKFVKCTGRILIFQYKVY